MKEPLNLESELWLAAVRRSMGHGSTSAMSANLRLSLGVAVRPGNERAAAKGLPGLRQTLEKLPRHQWPTFSVAIDSASPRPSGCSFVVDYLPSIGCGDGSEAVMLEHEEHGLPSPHRQNQGTDQKHDAPGSRWEDGTEAMGSA